MPRPKSRLSLTFSAAIGCQKLGQPVPDSNLVAESYNAVSQHRQRNTPLPVSRGKAAGKAASGPSWGGAWYDGGGSWRRHSASHFTTRGNCARRNRVPSSENSTIGTSAGLAPEPAAAASLLRL